MPSLIDWYVVELKHLLSAGLPLDRVDEIVRESESHLRESVQSHLRPGVDAEEAARLAIEAYGQPARVASAFLARSSRRMAGIDPIWWVAACSLLAVWCWNFEWMTFRGPFDIFGESWLMCAVLVAGAVGLGLLAKSVRAGFRSYRAWILGIGLGIVALSRPLMSFWMIPGASEWQGISRLHLSRDIGRVEQTLTRMGAYREYVERGLAAYSKAKSSKDLPADLLDPVTAQIELHTQPAPGYFGPSGYEPVGGMPVPSPYGADAMVDGRIWALNTAKDFEAARGGWRKNGPLALAALPRQLDDMALQLRNAREAQHGRLFFPQPELSKEVAIHTLELLPLLLLIDWLASSSVTRRKRWARKRLVVA
ncbi:MAG TPA: hypothetical protein VKT78_00195 [Fimbriimonadaceae bacterium]|nr:hypothetical protein [Fimbriimonadaceae bacterium]